MVTRSPAAWLARAGLLAALAALAAAPGALAQSGRFAIGEKGYRSVDEFAKAAPADVVTRVREIERGLEAFGPHARFTLIRQPADLLVVSLIEPARAKTLVKRLAAAHALLRKLLVEPPGWKRLLEFTVKPVATSLTKAWSSDGVLVESVSGTGGLSDLRPGMAFDVTITEGVVTNRDELGDRPGLQVGAGSNGLLALKIDKGRLDTARTGIVTAQAVNDPQLGGWGEAHFSLSDPPVRNFPIVFLVTEEEGEYLAALKCLETAFPLTPDRAAQVKAARTMSGFTSDYPACVVFRDYRRRLPGDEKWVTENRLVHALAHVMPTIYYGPLPFTIAEAIAWHVEMEVASSVESFCPYGGVAPDADSIGWAAIVAERKKKAPASLDVAEALSLHASGLVPESRDPDVARREMTARCAIAWEVVRWALAEKNAEFRAFLHRLRGASEWEGPPKPADIAATFLKEVGDPFK